MWVLRRGGLCPPPVLHLSSTRRRRKSPLRYIAHAAHPFNLNVLLEFIVYFSVLYISYFEYCWNLGIFRKLHYTDKISQRKTTHSQICLVRCSCKLEIVVILMKIALFRCQENNSFWKVAKMPLAIVLNACLVFTFCFYSESWFSAFAQNSQSWRSSRLLILLDNLATFNSERWSGQLWEFSLAFLF